MAMCELHDAGVVPICKVINKEVLGSMQCLDLCFIWVQVLHFCPLKGSVIKASQQDTQWASWTCVLGFPVMGIWPKDSDGTDINACDRSPSCKHLATADDSGKVVPKLHLSMYPI